MKLDYKHTLAACYLGYIAQAVVNNLPPLLFVTFSRQFGVSIEKIAVLITVNFVVQIAIDIAAAAFVGKLGYRVCGLMGCAANILGLAALGTLPFAIDPFVGIAAAMMLNAIGGGMMEVIVSPMVEALPGEQKSSAMSLLHSFYCWGQVGVVLLSTGYFVTAGIENWRFLPLIWAVIPLADMAMFAVVPIRTLEETTEKLPLRKLFSMKIFWLLALLMVCSGASEMAVSQWSSLFAELGLKVDKSVGDILGPCAFAALMGSARAFFGIKGGKFPLKKALAISGTMCVASYCLTVFSPYPLLSLAGCALTGCFVGIMWPGVYSLSAQLCPGGATAMFAILALAGDAGCALGPSLVGAVSDRVTSGALPELFKNGIFSGLGTEQISLRQGIMAGAVFPLVFAAVTIILCLRKRKTQKG